MLASEEPIGRGTAELTEVSNKISSRSENIDLDGWLDDWNEGKDSEKTANSESGISTKIGELRERIQKDAPGTDLDLSKESVSRPTGDLSSYYQKNKLR